MTDRRSKTSRRNLGKHIPEALDPEGTTVVCVRLPKNLIADIDEKRGARTRSEYVRNLVEAAARGESDLHEALRAVLAALASEDGTVTVNQEKFAEAFVGKALPALAKAKGEPK